jgi:uncharacterized membrane protein YfcA
VVVIQDPLFYLAAIPAVTFLGLSKGGFAGVGTLATPLLAVYAPPLQAAAILLPILITQDMISIWTYRRAWDGWNVKVLTPGALVGIGVAWVLAAYVSDSAVRITVGLIGLAFVLNAWFGRLPQRKGRPGVPVGVFWGAVSGFTSTLAQGGGPPFQVYVLPQRLPKLTLVGTTTIFFAIVNALKVVPYFALGQFSTDGLGTSVVLLPLAVLTNFLGIWLVRVTPTELFYLITYVLVLLISIVLLWQGLAPYFRG